MRRQKIREDAAAWVVRLSVSADATDRKAFEHWRAADVEHDIAFEQERFAWERLDRLSALRPPNARPDPNLILAAAVKIDKAAKPTPARERKRWAMTASLALTLGAGAGAGVLAPFISAPAYATATGERRSVRLADGTVVELNTHSRIIVRYSGHRRAIRLVRGEAVFHVAEDPRPFLVQTRAADVDAQHADVDVRLAGQSTRISVQAGHALAQPLGTTAGSVSLAANEMAVFGKAGLIVQKVSADDMDRALAWRRGVIALNGETLANAVEEFNRYSLRKIKVVDPSIASLHLGGYFNVDDVEGFADAVTRTFPVIVVLSPDGDLLMKHRADVRPSATLKS